jgi:hypothetical protein
MVKQVSYVMIMSTHTDLKIMSMHTDLKIMSMHTDLKIMSIEDHVYVHRLRLKCIDSALVWSHDCRMPPRRTKVQSKVRDIHIHTQARMCGQAQIHTET